jgi:glucose dehydrogenase
MYIGTGNAYPEQGRTPGKSLWADSIVSLDIKTGQLKWYYQTVHHDIYDYDCPTPPVLFNTTMAGKLTKAVAVGCKTGYIYVRNRVNGGALSTYPMPETPVPDLNGGKGAELNSAWPTQPIPTGAVAQLTIHCPTEAQIKIVFPSYPVGPNGTPMVPTCPFASPTNTQYYMWADGTDYQRMSYDPKTNDLYVCARSRIRGYENISPTDWHVNTVSGLSAGWVGSVSAINASKNTLDWQVQYQGGVDGPCYSGIITTASGLLFTASEGDAGAEPGTFYAYDAKTGKQLWSWKATDVIYSAPITYSVKGKQYVALMVNGPVSTGKRDLLTVFSL